MNRTCIAIIDASRARLFTMDRTSDAGGVREELVEQTDLINPARHQRPSAMFSDAPGKGYTGSGRGYGFDDHHAAHFEEVDLAFARLIASELQRFIREPQVTHLIVCASPRMLGNLRQASGRIERDGLTIDEVPRDLVELTPPQIRAHLTSYGLLPA